MKKFTYILSFFLMLAVYTFAQGEVEAWQFSRNGLYGTARSTAMGGAFGALGGDQTGVSINPAGIAVYRSSEVAGTFALGNESSKVGGATKNMFTFDTDHLGFVSHYPLRNNSVSLINFGFSYNKLKSFDKDYSAGGNNRATSLTDFIVNRHGDVPLDLLQSSEDTDPFYRPGGAHWLPIIAYQGFLILPDNGGYKSILNQDDEVSNSINVKERGSIDSYDFTVGTSIKNVLNLGMSLSVTSIDYRMTSTYTEDFPTGGGDGFDLNNVVSTTGAGFGVKFGAIYRPTNTVRLGLAYHSPTWYSMTDLFSATLAYKIDGYVNNLSSGDQTIYNGIDPDDRFVDTKVARWDYSFTTPSKLVASAAGVFGTSFILSADYELTNYKSMKFSGDSNEYEATNIFIDEDSKAASTIRVGAEYRFTPQFSGRLGYAWMQNPYNETFKNEQGDAMTSGTASHYRMEGDANYLTAGIGYRFNRNFYLDAAVVYKMQQDDLYPYPNIMDNTRTNIVTNAYPYTLDNSTVRGILTLGYKF